MKVLLVTRAGTGGAGRHVRDVVAGLSGRHEITVAASPREDPGYLDVLREAGATVLPLPLRRGAHPLADLRALTRLRIILERHPYELIHAHAAKPGLLARTAATSQPVVYSPHGFYHHYPTAPERARRRALAVERGLSHRTAVLALCGQWEIPVVRGEGIRPGGRVMVIPNGLPSTPRGDDPAARDEVRRELGVAPEETMVLWAGRLAPPKTPGLFVNAADHLPPAFRCFVAGEGSWFTDLRARSSRVGLLGHRGDIPRLLAAADVAVLTSLFEASPYFPLEALAAGVPVVATDLPATREILGDSEGLVPHGKVGALAEAIRAAVDGGTVVRMLRRVPSLEGMLRATEEVWAAAREVGSHSRGS